MLRNTFLHLRGVGLKTEEAIWKSGVATWDDFLEAGSSAVRAGARRDRLEAALEEGMERLARGDAAHFDRRLKMRERWRMYADFRETTAFLDIETTGLSPERSYVTMVGILDVNGYAAYVRGENLDDLRAALEQYDLIVTYNGASFDLPYLEHHFGRLFHATAHLDLRTPLRRLGLTGGLKSIEQQTGLGRPSVLSGLNGYDAVRLWRAWEGGNAGARDTLVRYNAEDVASLPLLADLSYNRLAEKLPLEVDALRPLEWPTVDHLPLDVGVIKTLQEGRLASRAWW